MFITPVFFSVLNTGAKNSHEFPYSDLFLCIQLLPIGLTGRLFAPDVLEKKKKKELKRLISFHWFLLSLFWPASLRWAFNLLEFLILVSFFGYSFSFLKDAFYS